MSKRDNFLRWLRENGCKFQKVKWPDTKNTNLFIRGCIAEENIEEKSVILELPHRLLISEPMILLDSDVGTYVSANESILRDDYIMLCLSVMSEIRKGSASFYFPYLSIFPTGCTAIDWNEEELSYLQVLVFSNIFSSIGSFCLIKIR